jgi:hypothetical protein
MSYQAYVIAFIEAEHSLWDAMLLFPLKTKLWPKATILTASATAKLISLRLANQEATGEGSWKIIENPTSLDLLRHGNDLLMGYLSDKTTTNSEHHVTRMHQHSKEVELTSTY